MRVGSVVVADVAQRYRVKVISKSTVSVWMSALHSSVRR
jgi:hypothetical protein